MNKDLFFIITIPIAFKSVLWLIDLIWGDYIYGLVYDQYIWMFDISAAAALDGLFALLTVILPPIIVSVIVKENKWQAFFKTLLVSLILF